MAVLVAGLVRGRREERNVKKASLTPAPDEIVLDRVLTVPNLISATRMALIPVFAWVFLTGDRDTLAFVLLVIIGSTDWVDGYVARATGQVSKLGKLLDPVADRLAIIVALLTLTFRGLVPTVLAVILLVRDTIVSIAFPVLEKKGFPRIPVNWVGKWATALIFAGMGFAAAGALDFEAATFSVAAGRVLLTGGAVLYWAALGLYVAEIRKIVRAAA